MIRPAIIVTHPLHLDFPVFRWNMERFKNYFDSIWISFSNHHVPDQDLSNFIRAKLPFCRFIEPKRQRSDWRDDAVNNALDTIILVPYICFLEQDFLIHDENFFEKVFADDHDFIFYQEEGRIHPAFAVVKRKLVEQTSRDFSASPPGDHFYKFFNELPQGINIDDLGVVKREDYFHMAGLSQNYMNFKYDEPFYHPNNFLTYNYLSTKFPDQHPGFLQTQLAIERKYGHPAHSVFLERFFPND